MASLTSSAGEEKSGENLCGIWNEVHIENLDAFLAALGIGWFKRKAAKLLMKREKHIVLLNTQTIIIRTEGKPGGLDEKRINIGKPTEITSNVYDPGAPDNTSTKKLVLNMRWNETKDILLNDLVVEKFGGMHVERWIIGEQMKVEVTHTESGVKMYRMFDKVPGSNTRLSETADGKLEISDL